MNNAAPGQQVRVKTAGGQIISGIVKDGSDGGDPALKNGPWSPYVGTSLVSICCNSLSGLSDKAERETGLTGAWSGRREG